MAELTTPDFLYIASSVALSLSGLAMVAIAANAYLETERREMLTLSVGFCIVVAAAIATTVSAFGQDFADAVLLLTVNYAITTVGYLFIIASVVNRNWAPVESGEFDRPHERQFHQFGHHLARERLVGHQVEPRFVRELRVLADGLADADVAVGEQSGDMRDDAGLVGVGHLDGDDVQVEDGREVHQARNLADVLEDAPEFVVCENCLRRGVDDPAVDARLLGDLRVRNLDVAGDHPTLVVHGEPALEEEADDGLLAGAPLELLHDVLEHARTETACRENGVGGEQTFCPARSHVGRMRQLDSCDFCGERAEGVFEVVPGSAAGGARRLALCSDCRETLQSVVDPLLDDAKRTTASSDSQGAADSPDDEPDPRGPATRPTPSPMPNPPRRRTPSASRSASVTRTARVSPSSPAARRRVPRNGGPTATRR